MDLAALTALYDEYVDTYRDPNGHLPDMMRLKRAHTQHVVDNAALIAAGEGFTPVAREGALIAALLHDTGRYEQLKRFNTFRDCDSLDHAVFSHDIVAEKGWLRGYDREEAVLKAVLYHNRRDLPDGMDPLTAVISKTVRDADKLDIFCVLEDRVSRTDWRNDTRAFWNLKVVAPPNPDVVECIAAHAPVDYQKIETLADFVLIQVGWMMNELYFATSRRLCRERGHLAFRRRFMRELTDSPAVDRICDLAEMRLAEVN